LQQDEVFMRTRFDPLAMSSLTLGLGRRLTELLETIKAEAWPFMVSPAVVAPTAANGLLWGNTPLADLALRAGLTGHRALHVLRTAERCAMDWNTLNAYLERHPRLPAGTRMTLMVRGTHDSLLNGEPDLSCRPDHIPPVHMLALGVSLVVMAERVAQLDKARRWSARTLQTFTVDATGRPPLTVEAPGPRQALLADRFLHWTYIPSGTVRVVRDSGGSIVAHTKTRP
jgi:hypothetical protein